MTRALFLSYDGLTDPLGQSQILPYLSGLSKNGHDITVISCDKSATFERESRKIRNICDESGVAWHTVRYFKNPPVASTMFDLTRMGRLARLLQNEKPFDVIHCRNPIMGILGQSVSHGTSARLLFDMRGFWIDERFERGIWSESNPAYRVIAAWLRKRERELFASADAVVSLTHAARDELFRRGGEAWASKTAIIPCCADLDHFDPRNGAARAEGRAMLGLAADAPVLLFLGSLGGAYPLEPVFRFYQSWSRGRPGARLLFVTRHPAAEILTHPGADGLADQIIIRPGERADMPALIAAADVGLSFILPSFCAIASSPTKVGEMLAMGIPVAANAGVGDMAQIMTEPGAGVLLPDLTPSSVDQAAAAMRDDEPRPHDARAVANKWYSLDGGVASYDRIYRELQAR